MKKDKKSDSVVVSNRKALFNYSVINELECGIVLAGTEVKSIRAGKVNFVDAYCQIENGELFLNKMNIAPYTFGNIYNHNAERSRKLLANRKEITKLERQVKEKGITLIPLKLYFKGFRVKILVALCKGKKDYDKRETIKEKDVKRQMDRDLSKY